MQSSTTWTGTAGGGEAGCRLCGSPRLDDAGDVKGFPFVTCSACALTYTPAVTNAVLEDLYANGHNDTEAGAPEEGWSSIEAEFLEPALARLPDRPLRVLDFGTGQSLTPDALRAQGHRVIAVDVAPPIPQRAHPDRLTGRLLTLPLEERAFDLAYTFQVMEHIPEPRPVLERLLALARPGGLVLFHTDMETPERFEGDFTDWWYVLPPDHCAFYRHRTFERFLEGTPHRIVFKDAKRVVVRVGGDADTA